MLGYETRDLAIEERNAVGIWRLERDAMVRFGRKARACTAGSADAAHRCGMRRAASAVGGGIMVAVAVVVRMLFRNCSAPMVRFAKRHQHAGVTAQRQSREQHDEQDDP